MFVNKIGGLFFFFFLFVFFLFLRFWVVLIVLTLPKTAIGEGIYAPRVKLYKQNRMMCNTKVIQWAEAEYITKRLCGVANQKKKTNLQRKLSQPRKLANSGGGGGTDLGGWVGYVVSKDRRLLQVRDVFLRLLGMVKLNTRRCCGEVGWFGGANHHVWESIMFFVCVLWVLVSRTIEEGFD